MASPLSLIRSQGIFDAPKYDQGITIIGAGAVGSRVFQTLVELGLVNITVYDPDVTEPHNLNNQAFVQDDVGHYKISGLYRWTERKLGYVPEATRFHAEYVTPDTKLKGSVFLLVDSLAERAKLFEHCLMDNLDVPRFIDTRMNATNAEIYVGSPHVHAAQYLATLGNDDNSEVSACGAPYSVAPTAAITANLAVWRFIQMRQDPLAVANITNIYLSPFILAERNFDQPVYVFEPEKQPGV
jgi:hypothetical protein